MQLVPFFLPGLFTTTTAFAPQRGEEIYRQNARDVRGGTNIPCMAWLQH